jgi:hypothetical protein
MKSRDGVLVSVDAPHFNAGIIMRSDVVTEAAPILRWTIGKRRDWLRTYFAGKGWKATVVKRKAVICDVAFPEPR